MKTLIIGLSCLVLSACTFVKSDNEIQEEDISEIIDQEIKSDTQEEHTFAKDAKDFLEAFGLDDEATEEYVEQIEGIEKVLTDTNALNSMLEGLISKEQLKELGDLAGTGNQQQETIGDMDELLEAFEGLDAEESMKEIIGKLEELDGITDNNSSGNDGSGLGSLIEKALGGGLEDQIEKAKERMTPQEEQIIRGFRESSKTVHSVQELEAFTQKMETMDVQKMIEEGKVTPAFVKAHTREVKNAKYHLQRKTRKATQAKEAFKALNPDLYFGEDVGMTYFAEQGDAIYLPLGSLSFVDKVIDHQHPKAKDHPEYTLGEPDGYNVGTNDLANVYSLGLRGTLTVKFEDNALVDVNGPDLFVFEMGAIEPTNLEISKDGKQWIQVGKIKGGIAAVDINEFVQPNELFYYVRLTDLVTSSAIPGADVDAIGAIGSAMRLSLDSKVLFDTGESKLKSEGKEALLELVEQISILKSGRVIIEGHTDDVGRETNNQKLSLERAKSVSAELKKLISSDAFSWAEKGYGESQPLVDNDSDENRAKNRRVEILVLPN